MTTNKKLWIAFGVVIALCACTALGGYLLLREAGSRFKESIKTDPAEVGQVGSNIADYTVPSGYVQQMAMSILGYDFVVIAPPDSHNGMMIMLAGFNQSLTQGYDEKSFQEQMQRSFEQQSGRRGLNMKVVETKKMTIRGEEVNVTILEGSDESGVSLRQLMVIFPAKNGMGMVMIQSLKEQWDQQAVDQFLQSIH